MAPTPPIELKPLPPREAIDYFRAKGFKPGFAWQDVWQTDHAKSFTVAKAMQLDVLEDLRGAVDRAIADGTTFDTFVKELGPTLKAKGWWGKQRMVDPLTGKQRVVQLGSPRRLRTIFDVNLRTSYAAGRWDQIQRTKRLRPYLRYVAVQDRRTRPEHAAWHGTILPVDHEWWLSHYPPNGWLCRCTVRQLSARDVERLGGVSEVEPTETRLWVNKRTGEEIEVAEGIDPGWDYHVGRAADAARRDATLEDGLAGGATRGLLDKLAAARPDIAHAALREVVRSPEFARHLAEPGEPLPVLRLPASIAQAIGVRNPVAVLSKQSLEKNLREHEELTPADYRMLPEVGAEPYVVLREKSAHTDTLSAIVIHKAGQHMWLAAVKATLTGQGAFVTSFRGSNPGDIRRLLNRGAEVIFDRRVDGRTVGPPSNPT